MTFEQRLANIRDRLIAAELDYLIAVHDGAHFIEKPDPVMVITGFKALGPVAAVLDRDGAISLVVTPSWDAERARETCPNVTVVAADDLLVGLATIVRPSESSAGIGIAGLGGGAVRYRETFDRSFTAQPLGRRHYIRRRTTKNGYRACACA